MADRNFNSKITRDVRNRPMISDARLIWRNFAGAEKQFNPAGKRNVTLVLTEEMFAELEAEGYNVKRKAPRNPDEDELLTLELKVNYSPKTRDPRLILINSGGRTQLTADTVAALDFARFVKVDIVLNPYDWVMRENTPNEERGRSAYLEQGYFTIEENAFEAEYNQIPDAGGRRSDTQYEEPDLDRY
jgi:hypothetical protein